MIPLEISSWTSSDWTLILSIIGVGIAVGIIGRNISISINEMKPEVKKIPVIEKTVAVLEKTLDNIGHHINKVENKLDDFILSNISRSNSPRVLNDTGFKLAQDSGIVSIVENNEEKIYRYVLEKNPFNAYRAELAVKEAVQQLAEDPDLNNSIETGAFKSGYSKSTILLAGALYIRDRILSRLKLI